MAGLTLDQLAIIVIVVVIIILVIWWIWSSTNPPQTISPTWQAQLDYFDGNPTGSYQVNGNLRLDPELEQLSYIINIKGLKSTIVRSYFTSSIDQKNPLITQDKQTHYSVYDGNVVLAGIWSKQDTTDPLTIDSVDSLFDGKLKLIIATDLKPSGELFIIFKNVDTSISTMAPNLYPSS